MDQTSELTAIQREEFGVLTEKPGSKRNTLKVMVVGDDGKQRTDIRSALAELSEPELEIAEARPQLVGRLNSGTEVAMVVVDGGAEASLDFIQAQAQNSPRPALFALLSERSSSLMRRALRAGADEVLFLPMDHGDATRALLKISEARRRTERPGRGQIISLVSITGGVGVTTLAANFSLGLRLLSQKQVAVVDLDFQSSDLSALFNLEPERNITALAESVKELDSIRLEAALSKHSSGVYLLPGPKRIEDAEAVTPAHVGAALDLMRQLFDFIVVDCGRNIDETAVAVWERSDYLFYVLDQSLTAVRSAARFLDLFERLQFRGTEPNLVLNRYLPRNLITERQVSETLERPIYAKIARDDKTCELALTRAQDFWKVAPNSPIANSLEDLVRRVTGAPEAQVEHSGGLFSRLFANTHA